MPLVTVKTMMNVLLGHITVMLLVLDIFVETYRSLSKVITERVVLKL